MPTYACCENAVCGYVAPSVTCVQLIPSTVLPLAPPATSPELLLHDDVPLVYQLMSPLTKPSSAVTTVEPLTGAVVGVAVGDGEGDGEGDELETGGGLPPPVPGPVGGVAPPPPPPPPQAARENNTAGASSAAERRDGVMQS